MNNRRFWDALGRKTAFLAACSVIGLLALITAMLLLRSRPVFLLQPLRDVLFSPVWRPAGGQFGLWSFIVSTFIVTGIAMFIAVPLSILTAVYIAGYAPRAIRRLSKPVIDLLAGISPVIYGVWGVIAVVPLAGYSALAGGIVLAVMVLPVIISVSEEVLRMTPPDMREASLALGATDWQTTKFVELRRAAPGIIGAVILGLSRALGETMAVLMVTGCALHGSSHSVFDTAYPLPALIANTYGEMMSIPSYDAALLFAALVLLAITAAFNMTGQVLLAHVERNT